MLTVISPAKTLDYETPHMDIDVSTCRLLDHSESLIQNVRDLSVTDIESLMKVSEKIALLNHQRFLNWSQPIMDDGRAAIFAFKGDVYSGINSYELPLSTLQSINKKTRILSGLYGLLRPFDNILPYRLEMGTKLVNERGSNLYHFWDGRITDLLNQDIANLDAKYIVNLASNEYWKAISAKDINATVITPVFKDTKNGKVKVISFYAKKARGVMTRWLAENDINSPDELSKFDLNGYIYDSIQSTPEKPVFIRAEL